MDYLSEFSDDIKAAYPGEFDDDMKNAMRKVLTNPMIKRMLYEDPRRFAEEYELNKREVVIMYLIEKADDIGGNGTVKIPPVFLEDWDQ